LSRRLASTALSCVEKIACSESDAVYELWQSQVGIAEANNYLCTADARIGESRSKCRMRRERKRARSAIQTGGSIEYT